MRAAGLQLRRLTGRELTSRDWDSFYDFYINTTGATSSSDFRMQTAFSDAPRTFTIARLRNAYRSLERCQEHQKQSSVHRLPRAVPDMRGAQIFCCERGLAGIGPHGTSQPSVTPRVQSNIISCRCVTLASPVITGAQSANAGG